MLTSLAFVFLIGIAFSALFARLKLPGLVGMILAGILLGPYGLNLLDAALLGISTELRQMALVIILMRAGLALNLQDLRRVGRPALLICFVPASFEILGMILLATRILDISILEAAIMGSVVAAVSPAVVVPRMLRLMEQGYGTRQGIPQLIMAGASVDDVFVIVLFSAFTSLATGETVSASSFIGIPVSIVLGVFAGLLVGFLLNRFFQLVRMRDSVKLLVILSISFLLLALETRLEGTVAFSGLLAVMFTGVSLLRCNSALAGRLSTKTSKLWIAAEVLLFVLVGATVDVSYAAAAGVRAVMLVLAVLLFRMAGVLCCLLGTQFNRKERLFCMVSYLPKATVQAAIGGLPLAMGLACGNMVLTVAVLSILITAPLGAIAIDGIYQRCLQRNKTETVTNPETAV